MSQFPTVSENLPTSASFDVLAALPVESVWLANQNSQNTVRSYKRAVSDFVVTMGIDSSEGLYSVRQSHVIAYRQTLRDRGLKPAAIAVRLAALSSLYKELADKQLVPLNPVSGVKRPKSGDGGIGSGKTPQSQNSLCGQCWTPPILRQSKACEIERFCTSYSSRVRVSQNPPNSGFEIFEWTPIIGF